MEAVASQGVQVGELDPVLVAPDTCNHDVSRLFLVGLETELTELSCKIREVGARAEARWVFGHVDE